MSLHRRMEELNRSASLQLLGTVPVGRVVFTHHALPAIRPVNFLVDYQTESVIVRATMGAAITAAAAGPHGVVVAFEADALDPARQLGWSVIVVGTARPVTDTVAAERHRKLLEPWIAGATDEVIAISTDMVHGFRVAAEGPFSTQPAHVAIGVAG